MTLDRELRPDVVVVGGGIAGLWMLARLRRAGYSALLLERRALGGVQTVASQGIIHGGTKYALAGRLTGSAQAIAAMPGVWRDCLAGTGELDLSRVRLLSDHQYLWSTGGLASELTGFFASQAMRSRVGTVTGDDRPEPLRDPAFHGHVYRLDEPVLDVVSLVAELHRQLADASLLVDPDAGLAPLDAVDGAPGLALTHPDHGTLRLRPRRLVLAAGAGNEDLLHRLGRERPVMQRRPVHMLMARGPLRPLYAHCLGASASPRITVTSHPLPDGDWVWYLGGQISETGVARDEAAQIAEGRRELAELLPWQDLTRVRWATLRVDRAEPRQPGGLRPENCFLETRDGLSVAWPTKLAFSPLLAARLLEDLEHSGIEPAGAGSAASAWPRPALAPLPWEAAERWI